MTNVIKKKCPICGHGEVDIQGAIIAGGVSYNLYKCVLKKHQFMVPRKGNVEEQQLTEEFIKSKFIVLTKTPKKKLKPRTVTIIDTKKNTVEKRELKTIKLK